jgi:hypothetical protein
MIGDIAWLRLVGDKFKMLIWNRFQLFLSVGYIKLNFSILSYMKLHIFYIDIYFIFSRQWKLAIFCLLLNYFQVTQNSKQAFTAVVKTSFEDWIVYDEELLLFKQTYLRRYSIFAGERGDKYPLSVGKWYLTDWKAHHPAVPWSLKLDHSRISVYSFLPPHSEWKPSEALHMLNWGSCCENPS